jgi:hypothetical protein
LADGPFSGTEAMACFLEIPSPESKKLGLMKGEKNMSETTVSQAAVHVGPQSNVIHMSCTLPDYKIKCAIEIYESQGSVHIKWNLPKPYVFSVQPKHLIDQGEKPGVAITLFGADNQPAKTMRTLQREGVWNTEKSWGTGWSAHIAAWDYDINHWMEQCRTPKTVEKP